MADITRKQVESYLKVCTAVVDTVKECGTQGAPSGVIFAALQSQGCTLEQYNRLLTLLLEGKILRREGDVLFAA